MRKIAVLIICVFVIGCNGFKLRAAQKLPSNLQTICIVPYEPYEPLQRTLRAHLLAQKVQITRDHSPGIPVLHLNKASTSEEILAVGSSGEVQRYKLSMNASYSLNLNSSGNLQHTVVRSRELNRSNNMLLSNEGEEQIVKRELLNEVAYEILRQITATPIAGTP